MKDWIDVTGWTLLHFAWQGAVIGLLIAGALRLCRRRSARARQAVAAGGLVALLAAPAVTAAVLWQAARAAEPGPPRLPERAGDRAPRGGAASGRALAVRGSGDGPGSLDAVHARLAAALPAVVAVWLAGASLLLVRGGSGAWRARRLHAAGLAAPVSRWQAAASRLASRLGLASAVRVVESRLVGAPALVGRRRPIVLLPAAALAGLTPAQVEALLAHELTGVGRRGRFAALLQSLAETLLFFHPAVWWTSGRMRAERERRRAAAALAIGGDPAGYASALAALEEWRGPAPAPPPGADAGPLGDPARRFAERRPFGVRPRFRRGRLAACAALALCAGLGAALWPW